MSDKNVATIDETKKTKIDLSDPDLAKVQLELERQTADETESDARALQNALFESFRSDLKNPEREKELKEQFGLSIGYSENKDSSRFAAERLSNVFERALQNGQFGELKFDDPITACLLPLLETLGWQGTPRELAEAIPHEEDSLSLKDLRNTMARLGFASKEYEGHVSDLDNRVMPALYILENGRSWIIRETNGKLARVYDGATKSEKAIVLKEQKGLVVLFVTTGDELAPEETDKNWLKGIFARFRPTIAGLFGVTAIINILSLAVSLVIMAIYDMVIPSKSEDTLAFLVVGVIVALGIEFILRIVKSSVVGFLGGRFEFIVSTASFAKTLSLPLEMVENSSLGAQTARLKEFESIRDVFVGPFMSIGLELPFVIMFIAIIFFIGGPLAIVPIVVLCVYVILTFIFVGKLRRTMTQASRQKSERTNFLLEACNYRDSVKHFRGENIWLEKYRQVSANASYAHFKTHRISGVMQVVSQAVVTSSGAATMAIGAYFVLEEQLSIGALIACMILSWRVLGPIQSLFFVFSRFETIRRSIRQMDQLMTSQSEPSKAASYAISRKLSGAIEFERVQFRYKGGQDVALMGVNFKIDPGQMLAIMGPSGAGKTTLLKMILGLYRAPSGRIYVDGIDIRQLDPRELRHNIGYVPQTPQYFDDTIAQNMRLTNPTASDDEIREVCDSFGILGTIENLPNGFETRMSATRSDSVSNGLRQALTVAGAMMRKPSVLLLDEPAHRMDSQTDQHFTSLLAKLKSKVTIIMTSHRPSHIKMADKLLVLERGVVLGLGKPEDILSRIEA